MYNGNGHKTLERARMAAKVQARRGQRPVRIIHDTDENTYRTTVVSHAWPQYQTVEEVQPPQHEAVDHA